MKKRLWMIHSWLGLLAGLGLLVIGITGSMLVFRDQWDGFLAPDLMRVEPTAKGRLPFDELLASARKAWPDFEVTGLGARRDPHLADVVYLMQRGDNQFRAATIDQYTGEARGNPIDPSRTFTGILLELHYTWFADHLGMLITGILAVVLCLLGVTGVWLYREFWRNFVKLRWRQSGRIFFSDLHKTIGISSVAFNLILGFTGAYWNLTHIAAEGLLHKDSESPKMTSRLYSDALAIDGLVQRAQGKIPGFEANWVSFPFAPGGDITLWGQVPSKNPLSGSFGSNAVFDPMTGELKSVTDLRNGTLWAKVTDTFMPLHYGTFGGWPIKILWAVGGLTPGALAITGFVLWRARRRVGAKRGGFPKPAEVDLAQSPAKAASLVVEKATPERSHAMR